VAFSPIILIFKASEMKMLKNKISIDSTVLLSYLLCPLFFPPIYFRGRRLCTLLPTHRPPFHRAIHGKPPLATELPHLVPKEKGRGFARGTGHIA
jgi:hypothetical protein